MLYFLSVIFFLRRVNITAAPSSAAAKTIPPPRVGRTAAAATFLAAFGYFVDAVLRRFDRSIDARLGFGRINRLDRGVDISRHFRPVFGRIVCLIGIRGNRGFHFGLVRGQFLGLLRYRLDPVDRRFDRSYRLVDLFDRIESFERTDDIRGILLNEHTVGHADRKSVV